MAMTNKEIYSRTIGFSVFRLLFDILAVVLLVALTAAGYFIADKVIGEGIIGLLIGLVIGIIVAVVAVRFISYTYEAGQIAMMTRAITEGELPDDVIAEGKAVVKRRFVTVAVYFAATKAIKGIFNELSNAISNVGESVGGNTGSTIGSVIGTVITVIVGYLCDCCLGWVFYREDENAAKATCEGAVLFFKHGKTLLKNLGRVFGIGLISLLIIGGVFTGIFYFIFAQFPEFFASLATNLAELGDLPDFFTDPATLPIAAALLVGIILWALIHGAFIRPFVLTGVLRNYLNSGMEDVPTEESFALLDSKSKKFAQLHEQLA